MTTLSVPSAVAPMRAGVQSEDVHLYSPLNKRGDTIAVTYILAGRADSLIFPKLELLAEALASRLPSIGIRKILKRPEDWPAYYEELYRHLGAARSVGPFDSSACHMVWTNGGQIIGNADEFADLIALKYGLVANLSNIYVSRKIQLENQEIANKQQLILEDQRERNRLRDRSQNVADYIEVFSTLIDILKGHANQHRLFNHSLRRLSSQLSGVLHVIEFGLAEIKVYGSTSKPPGTAGTARDASRPLSRASAKPGGSASASAESSESGGGSSEQSVGLSKKTAEPKYYRALFKKMASMLNNLEPFPLAEAQLYFNSHVKPLGHKALPPDDELCSEWAQILKGYSQTFEWFLGYYQDFNKKKGNTLSQGRSFFLHVPIKLGVSAHSPQPPATPAGEMFVGGGDGADEHNIGGLGAGMQGGLASSQARLNSPSLGSSQRVLKSAQDNRDKRDEAERLLLNLQQLTLGGRSACARMFAMYAQRRRDLKKVTRHVAALEVQRSRLAEDHRVPAIVSAYHMPANSDVIYSRPGTVSGRRAMQTAN